MKKWIKEPGCSGPARNTASWMPRHPLTPPQAMSSTPATRDDSGDSRLWPRHRDLDDMRRRPAPPRDQRRRLRLRTPLRPLPGGLWPPRTPVRPRLTARPPLPTLRQQGFPAKPRPGQPQSIQKPPHSNRVVASVRLAQLPVTTSGLWPAWSTGEPCGPTRTPAGSLLSRTSTAPASCTSSLRAVRRYRAGDRRLGPQLSVAMRETGVGIEEEHVVDTLLADLTN